MEKAMQVGPLSNKPKRFYTLSPARKKLIVEMIAAIFILLFLYTALNKTFRIGSTVAVLKKTPLFSNFPEVTAWIVVITEYIVAALLFFPKTRKLGLYSSLILMAGFTIYIGYMKAFVPDLPCSCGGVISKLTWNQHLIFNIFLTLLAWLGIYLMRPPKTSTR